MCGGGYFNKIYDGQSVTPRRISQWRYRKCVLVRCSFRADVSRHQNTTARLGPQKVIVESTGDSSHDHLAAHHSAAHMDSLDAKIAIDE